MIEYLVTHQDYLHTSLFLTKNAVTVLNDLISGSSETLALDCGDGEFYAINVIEVLDCINYEKSEYNTFKDGKRIMSFSKYVFEEPKIRNKHLFKIIDKRLGRPFVSDEFRNRVIDNNLTGFIFELAWDSEAEA